MRAGVRLGAADVRLKKLLRNVEVIAVYIEDKYRNEFRGRMKDEERRRHVIEMFPKLTMVKLKTANDMDVVWERPKLKAPSHHETEGERS